MTMYGIDVSSAQKGLNLKGTGAEFVIVKATDGIRFFSSTAKAQVEEAQKSGLLFGFYHFANGTHKSSMKSQAQYFVSHCKSWFGKGIPVLDWEDSAEKYGGAVLKHGPTAAKEFLDEVFRLTGVRPMIYMSASVTRAYDWSAVAKDYGLWGAGYAAGATYQNPKTSGFGWGAWKTPAIHQYGNSGGKLDVNIAYMDKSAWNKFANASGSTQASGGTVKDSTSSAPSGTTLELVQQVMEGKYGNDDARKNALGSRYSEVQSMIDHIASASAETLAAEVWNGKYGNGDTRKTVLGSRYDEVQAIVEKSGKTTASATYYTIKAGDTLYAIAGKYKTTVNAIAKLNPIIKNVSLIYPGQKIRVK